MAVRRIIYLPLDLMDRSRPAHVPPRGRNFTGPGDFIGIGEEFLGYFRRFGLIHPGSQILEIGCGMGRMAFPLRGFLSREGRYTGVDIVKDGIEWCEEHLSSMDGRFQFLLLDVRNDLYNPEGVQDAESIRFPFEDSAFDFVFLTSVFTHMKPAAVERYLLEISRMLKPGSSMLATFFLLNQDSRHAIRQGTSQMRFTEHFSNFSTMSKKVLGSNVALDEDLVRDFMVRAGLSIQQPVYYGSWSGRRNHLSFQDIVIAAKV